MPGQNKHVVLNSNNQNKMYFEKIKKITKSIKYNKISQILTIHKKMNLILK